jgi:hypothetical protein
MRHRSTAVLATAAVVAALWLSGCDRHATEDAVSANPPLTTPTAPAPQDDPLPDAGALTGLLGRLADPAAPGTDKLALIEDATGGDATALDNFTKALQDNRMVPLNFTATDLAWSERNPGNVVANVAAAGPDPAAPGFSFPMEFVPATDGWQLSRATTEQLLVFGDGSAPSEQPAPPTPTG